MHAPWTSAGLRLHRANDWIGLRGQGKVLKILRQILDVDVSTDSRLCTDLIPRWARWRTNWSAARAAHPQACRGSPLL